MSTKPLDWPMGVLGWITHKSQHMDIVHAQPRAAFHCSHLESISSYNFPGHSTKSKMKFSSQGDVDSLEHNNLSRIPVLSSSGQRALVTNGLNYREFECVLFSWTEPMQLWNNPVLKVCCPDAATAESFHEQQTLDHFLHVHTPAWEVDIHNLWKDSKVKLTPLHWKSRLLKPRQSWLGRGQS